jgi:hypothetical protein
MSTALDFYAPYDAGAGGNATEAGWRTIMRRVLATGVLAGVLNNFEVYADSTGLQVKVKSGECWIVGHLGQSTSEKILAVASNSSGSTRGDRVVLRNHFGDNRIVLDILTGVSATPPTVTQDTSMWEISLATISVPNADASIDAAQVTDARTWTETAPPIAVSDTQNTIGTTTSGSYTAALSGAGAATCSKVFTAPASGQVIITHSLETACAPTTDLALCSIEVKTGNVIGSGTTVLAAAHDNAVYSGNTRRGGSSKLLTGLTPGSQYNVRLLYAVTGGTGTYVSKHLIVTPG